MARFNDEKFKQMQDEMSRFEEEIGLPKKGPAEKKIIGTNTYSEAQKHLAASVPPIPLFVPHQVRGIPHRPGLNPQLNSALNGPIPFANPPFPGVLQGQEKPQSAVLSATPMLYMANQPQAEIPPQPTENPIIIHTEIEDPHAKKSHKREKKSDKYSDPETLKRNKKFRKCIRTAGGNNWEDPTLGDWEEDDFRLFCGDLGNDVTDEVLTRAFSKYPSFLRAKVVRDKRTNKTKGFGFVSFKDPQDFIRATKEMNGRYVGSRPIKLRKSTWRNRSLDVVRKKDKEKAALLSLLMQK